MGGVSQIKLATNTREFFYQPVHDFSLAPEIEFYLVELLCNPPPLDHPVALIFKEAVESPPDIQFKNFKLMGDTSLTISSLWPEHLKRKTVGIEYFTTMGQTGYNRAAGIAKNHFRDTHFYDFYTRLGDEFSVCQGILTRIAGALRPHKSGRM